MHDHNCNDFALRRYLAEKDGWEKFLVTGPKSSNDKAQALARDSQYWDVVLEEMLPPKAWGNSKSLMDNSDTLLFAEDECASES